jgi:uncharacterized protein YbbC (DUF1343 family)
MQRTILVVLVALLTISAAAQQKIKPGAAQMDKYLYLLEGKTIAVFANPTSMVNNTHLIDTLVSLKVKVKKIFAPEHGFRGTADAGEKLGDSKDEKTGIPVISLYGKHNKPTAEDVKDIDVLLFDIQDVGVRFYTFISSLQLYIEAAIEFNKPLFILDRPNPNGFYVDGPVLDRRFKSFVGMQPIPIVHGMTMGEYARMLIGEQWLDSAANKKYQRIQQTITDAANEKIMGKTFQLVIVECANYTHKSKYVLPVKPSPNLPNIQSIYLYPSTCFFEGTQISLGRGTDRPFQCFGHPSFPQTMYSFTPRSVPGAKEPPLQDQTCYGVNLGTDKVDALKEINNKIQLKWLLQAYQLYPDKAHFFLPPSGKKTATTDYFFNKLAGNDILMQQIIEGKTEKEIRASWEPGLNEFKKIRKKYLLYP